jgi:hypothetical protein
LSTTLDRITIDHPTDEDLSVGAPAAPVKSVAFCFPNFSTTPSRNGGLRRAIPTFSASTAGTFCEAPHEIPEFDLWEIDNSG